MKTVIALLILYTKSAHVQVLTKTRHFFLNLEYTKCKISFVKKNLNYTFQLAMNILCNNNMKGTIYN